MPKYVFGHRDLQGFTNLACRSGSRRMAPHFFFGGQSLVGITGLDANERERKSDTICRYATGTLIKHKTKIQTEEKTVSSVRRQRGEAD